MSDKRDPSGKEGFWRFQSASAAYEDLQPPPYQASNVYMSFIGVRFEPGAARALLPPELNPIDGSTGTICVYSVGSGWGIAPFTACFVAVEVDGYHALDGSPGYYLATGYYSGRGYQMMHFNYNEHAQKGGSRHFRDGDLAVGVGGPDGRDVLAIKSRPTDNILPESTGSRHYMGKRPQGGTNIFPIAFFGQIGEAEPLSVEIADEADERMKLARPTELLFGAECHLTLTFGRPRPIAERDDNDLTQASLLTMFSHIGKAAVLVGEKGEISVMNRDAEALLGKGIAVGKGKLQTRRPSDQKHLNAVIKAATNSDANQFDLDPIVIEREAGMPLLAQAMPIDIGVTGRPTALVLLNDPASEPTGNAVPALQLLGLTPAEARIADLVGAGNSPREAAEQLGNTQGTVRTSLNRIYEKLGISRQSELARIVARL